MEVSCRILVIREDGVYFGGPKHLVKDIGDSQVFTDLDEVLDRIRDYMTLAVSPVTQIRIVSEDFAKGDR